jgi:hypothetical protein
MDENVIRSMSKWPDVPHVYGWLRLDRRGKWKIRTGIDATGLRFEPIGNTAFNDFIARNYSVDQRGCWFFQNGPQRVFVGLDYAPFVFRFEERELIDHCGRRSLPITSAWLDDEGSLVLSSERGAGVLDDRELASIAEGLAEGIFEIGENRLRVGKISRREMGARFGFVREPEP